MTKSDSTSHLLTRGVAEVLPSKDSLATLLEKKKIKLYLGIDPTGAFLHLGHAVVLRKLQQFADLGHEVILLIGNGTVKIGDPTGRDESRPVLTDEQIEQNFQNWKEQASTILDFNTIKIMRNGDWLEKLNYSDIVKLLAKTTVQQLLERDMFQERLEQGKPIHGHEIIYPLLQGYDSVVMDVDLEIGGTDQTFNMMMGRTLQKIYNNREKWVLTTPIINGTDGRKMSKSFNNFVALKAEPKEMFGKLMSVSDELITEYLTLLTDLPLEEIEQISQKIEQGANPMQFKKLMAFTITADLHDQEMAKKAQKYFEKTVQQNELPANMPAVEIPQSKIRVLDILNLCQPEQSNARLKRLCEQGGVRLLPQDKQLKDHQVEIELEPDQVIRVGKRDYFRLQIKN
ncbi:MAG: Tyrosine--tRNA ligase [Microgenomates bacterium 39_7]|nr:MAG: Tyrosine--tRNA ligase [Microgenomates bacterium 39_7]